ncbi:MAG: hypothetical protein ABI286_02405, partial [Edaphobacter sp.]
GRVIVAVVLGGVAEVFGVDAAPSRLRRSAKRHADESTARITKLPMKTEQLQKRDAGISPLRDGR